MSHRVDAAVHHAEPSLCDAIGDRRAAQTGSEEIATGHHAPIAIGEGRQPEVHVVFDVHMTS
jgi:hypothetical protein